MKKIGILALISLCMVTVTTFAYAEELKPFNVYTEKRTADNHYIPSGWMGDSNDIKINDQYAQDPHSGSTCIQFVYTAKKSQGQGWAGVYWQNPANNWGAKKGGFDLTGMNKLTFWARGEKGGEKIRSQVPSHFSHCGACAALTKITDHAPHPCRPPRVRRRCRRVRVVGGCRPRVRQD